MKCGVIFDLDGTLWDASEQIFESWDMVLRRRFPGEKELTRAELAGYMGKTGDEIRRLMMPARCTPEECADAMQECFDEELRYLVTHPGTLYPAVRETLQEMQKRWSLMIDSNCQNGYVQTFLETQSLGSCFADFEMAGRSHYTKGTNARLLMERNGLERAVFVGDTAGDFTAAQEAGLPFIFAAYGFGTVEDAEHIAHTFADIPALAAKLLAE